jgi:hypothetical protein
MDSLESKDHAFSPLCSNAGKSGLVANLWRQVIWLGILVFSSFVFSVGLACATPFAALGAAAAVTLGRRDTLLVGGVVWLVNQFVGYTILRYPWTINSVGWGITLGAATLLASLAALWIYNLQRAIPSALRFAAVFAVAFSVFEGALYAAACFVLGGLQDFTFGIVLYIFVINAVTFVGLLVLYWLVMSKRLGHFAFAHSPSTRPAKIIG